MDSRRETAFKITQTAPRLLFCKTVGDKTSAFSFLNRESLNSLLALYNKKGKHVAQGTGANLTSGLPAIDISSRCRSFFVSDRTTPFLHKQFKGFSFGLRT